MNRISIEDDVLDELTITMSGDFDNELKKPKRYVFIVGPYKVGKSYIFDLLKQNYKIKDPKKSFDEVDNTRGETICCLNENEVCIVDTEGINQPLSTSSSSFIKSFILEHVSVLSSLILFVVDKFTESDWDIFLELVNMCRMQGPKQMMFIHNCRHFVEKNSIYQYQSQVLKILGENSFATSNNDKLYFDISLGQQNVRHIFMPNKKYQDETSVVMSHIIKYIGSISSPPIIFSNKTFSVVRDLTERFCEKKAKNISFMGDSFEIKFPRLIPGINGMQLSSTKPNYYIDEEDILINNKSKKVYNVHCNLPYYVKGSLKVRIVNDMKIEMRYKSIVFNRGSQKMKDEILTIYTPGPMVTDQDEFINAFIKETDTSLKDEYQDYNLQVIRN